MRANLSHLVFAALFVLCPLFAAAQTTLTATVAFVAGNAVVLGAKGAEKKLKVGEKVVQGDAVRLDDKTSRVVLMVSDGTELRLKGKTEMRFKQFNQSASGKTRKTRLELVWGSFWAKVAKLTTKSSRFEVQEGGVVCGVRGTVIGGWYDADTHEGGFFNFEGLVYTDNGDGPQDLPQGQNQPFAGNEYGSQGPNSGQDSGQFQFGSGGDDQGAGSGDGGLTSTQDLLADLTQDLGDDVGVQHDTDSNGAGTAHNNSNIQIQLDTPEGAGGNND